MDQLPRLGKRELICLLSFTCNYVVFVWRGFLFLWVLGMGYVILLWHSLSLPYNYFSMFEMSELRFLHHFPSLSIPLVKKMCTVPKKGLSTVSNQKGQPLPLQSIRTFTFLL